MGFMQPLTEKFAPQSKFTLPSLGAAPACTLILRASGTCWGPQSRSCRRSRPPPRTSRTPFSCRRCKLPCRSSCRCTFLWKVRKSDTFNILQCDLVDFDWGDVPSCPFALSFLPHFHLPKQKWAKINLHVLECSAMNVLTYTHCGTFCRIQWQIWPSWLSCSDSRSLSSHPRWIPFEASPQ